MTEHDEQDVTRTGATAASTQERYDDGMRTDDDQSVDPQEEVEERLKGIEEERRAERAADVASPRDDEGGDDDIPDDDIPTDRRTGESTGVAAEEGGDDARSEDDPRVETDEEKRAREEAFAAEHDPEQHDLSAGEEFRQAGDWTAEDGKLTEDDVADSAAGSDEQRRGVLIAALQSSPTLHHAAQVYAENAEDIGRLGLLDYAAWLAEHLPSE